MATARLATATVAKALPEALPQADAPRRWDPRSLLHVRPPPIRPETLLCKVRAARVEAWQAVRSGPPLDRCHALHLRGRARTGELATAAPLAGGPATLQDDWLHGGRVHLRRHRILLLPAETDHLRRPSGEERRVAALQPFTET